MATKKKNETQEDINLDDYLGVKDSSEEPFWTTMKNRPGNPLAQKAPVNKNSKFQLPLQPTVPTEPAQLFKPSETSPENEDSAVKRISAKQRKTSLEEYRNCFLLPPKITDRKTVYLSRETRDRLDEIVRRLGERGASISGFIENMARHHIEIYRDEIDQWKRL